jgi:hypothetical protein
MALMCSSEKITKDKGSGKWYRTVSKYDVNN